MRERKRVENGKEIERKKSLQKKRWKIEQILFDNKKGNLSHDDDDDDNDDYYHHLTADEYWKRERK